MAHEDKKANHGSAEMYDTIIHSISSIIAVGGCRMSCGTEASTAVMLFVLLILHRETCKGHDIQMLQCSFDSTYAHTK